MRRLLGAALYGIGTLIVRSAQRSCGHEGAYWSATQGVSSQGEHMPLIEILYCPDCQQVL